MELQLIKNENATRVDLNQLRFNLFKNMIKKDLEVACWSNKAIKLLGEFQIYSDYRSELNSFEYVLSYLTEKEVLITDDSLESHVSSQCSEYFLTLLILKDSKFKKEDIEALAIKLTNYLIEASEILKGESLFHDLITELDTRCFGDNDPTSQKYNWQF